MKGRSRLYPISIIMMAVFLAAGPANAVYAAEPNGSWVNLEGTGTGKKQMVRHTLAGSIPAAAFTI